MSGTSEHNRFQFGLRPLLMVILLIATFCASAAAIRVASPPGLLASFILVQAAHLCVLLAQDQHDLVRAGIRGVVVGAATSGLLLLLGGVGALAGLLPFLSPGNSLWPFLATPIGLLLVGIGFSLMLGMLSMSIRLMRVDKPVVGMLSLALLAVWLALVSVAVLSRAPLFDPSA